MSTKKVEHRSYAIRAAQGEEFVLAGRAVSYGTISSNELAPGLRERIMAGCFADSIASGEDVKALFNHQEMTTLPLGRLQNGTLKFADGPGGLDFRVQLDKNNSFHQQVYASVKRGDLDEMSFGFICEDEDYSDVLYEGKACQLRNVRKAKLTDVSIVTRPFYGDGATQVDARNAGAALSDEAFRAATLANLKQQQEDWARRDKAHAIGMALLDDLKIAPETRDADDFLSMRDQFDGALPSYKVVGNDEDFVYAIDANDEDNAVYRFGYELDKDGHVTVDSASRTQLKASEVSSVDERSIYAAFAERDLEFRLRSAAGITAR